MSNRIRAYIVDEISSILACLSNKSMKIGERICRAAVGRPWEVTGMNMEGMLDEEIEMVLPCKKNSSKVGEK